MNDLIHLRASFIEKSLNEEDQTMTIRGYASTISKDRVGDVIERNAWTQGGLSNYLKNPVILAFHDHTKPIGKMVEYSIDQVGLNITAKISKAAGDIIDLIKDGVLQAFSVGVRVKEADYDAESDTFLIKNVELHEISVVSVPANQDSLFSIAKCFDTETDFADFKQKFVKPETSGAPTVETIIDKKEEFIMDSNELEQMIAKALGNELSKQKAEEESRKAKELADTARREEIVSIAKSGAESLVEDLKKAMKESETSFASKLAELQGEIANKSEEIARITRDRSKVEFADRNAASAVSEKDVTEAVLLSKILNKDLKDTTLGQNLLQKAAGNSSSSFAVASDLWETTLSNRLEEDVRLQLVMAPRFREVALASAKQVISLSPDMGYADWVVGTQVYGNGTIKGVTRSSATTDPEVTKQLAEITLTTSKLAAKAFITDETEEDAIVPILPLIYDGLARAHSKAIEWAILNNDVGSGSGQSSVSFPSGLIKLSSGLSTTIEANGTAAPKVRALTGTDKFTSAHLIAARKKMGVYGYNPNDIFGVISLEAWYDLLEDTAFADISQVGAAESIKLSGVVGRMYGINLIVSPEMPAKANSAAAIVLINPSNYLIPRLRGMTVQSEYSVVTQQKTLVATQRIGFQPIYTSNKSVAVVTYDADDT